MVLVSCDKRSPTACLWCDQECIAKLEAEKRRRLREEIELRAIVAPARLEGRAVARARARRRLLAILVALAALEAARKRAREEEEEEESRRFREEDEDVE